MARLLADITPLRVVPAYRRLWLAISISNVGQQLTSVAVGLQVWNLTHSSWSVGLVGFFQLVPLVLLGMYGGALSDAHDRRTIGLLGALGMMTCSALFTTQALLGNRTVWVVYGLISVQSAVFAVGNPARQSIIPRIVPRELLTAANALSMLSWNVGFTAGPLLAGAIIAASGGVTLAYLIDSLMFIAMVTAMYRLPRIPPAEGARRAGIASIREELQFVRGKPKVQMTFYMDIIAMVFGMPRALFPAIAAGWYANGMATATALGFLVAGPTAGAAISSVFSGPLHHIRRQGLAIFISILAWGLAIAGFGLMSNLPLALLFLAIAGAADNVSAVFRTTILQAAVPDEFRGRLQGIFTTVVAGGPRLGDVEAGAVAAFAGERVSAVSGGLACVFFATALVLVVPRFLRYDAEQPVA